MSPTGYDRIGAGGVILAGCARHSRRASVDSRISIAQDNAQRPSPQTSGGLLLKRLCSWLLSCVTKRMNSDVATLNYSLLVGEAR